MKAIIFCLIFTFSTSVFAQNEDFLRYFWFTIKVKNDNKKKTYEIIVNNPQVESGSKKDFEKKLWWGFSNAQLLVGPFQTKEEAEIAFRFFKKTKNKNISLAEEQENQEVTWFLLTVKERKRSRSYQLVRNPVRLATGNLSEFPSALQEGLQLEKIIIGPFWSSTQAETAKNLYNECEW